MGSFSKLYLSTKAAPFTPTNFRGTWSDTGGQVTRALDTGKSDGGGIISVARAETNASNTFDVLLYRGVSSPLSAQTISGTLNVILGISENATNADFVYKLHVYVTAGDTDTVRGTLLSNYIETITEEWPTTAAGRALASAQSLSSLGISAGDRIVVEIGYRALNTLTSGFTGTLRYGTQRQTDLVEAADLTAGSSLVTLLAGFISFSNSITEPEQTARVTQFPVKIPSSGTKDARVTQFHPKIANSGTKEVRVSQFVAKIVSPNSVANQRVTQFVAKIVSENVEDVQSNVWIIT